jgi:radical SAM protein with 4Fe4S-binding SPASM domain
MVQAQTVVQAHPRVRWRWEGDKVLLTTFVGLNKTAGEVLEFARQPVTVSDICDAIAQQYPDVPSEKITADIENLCDQLLKFNILIPAGSENIPPPISFDYAKHIKSTFNNRLRAPLLAIVEPTFTCNGKCPHCAVSSTAAETEGKLSTEEWLRVFEEMGQMGVFTMTISGGEPLLLDNLEDLVRGAVSNGMKVTINSNGSLFTRKRLKSLMEAGVNGFQLNIDGVDAETHDSFRGIPGSYEKNMELLTWLRETDLDVQISTHITTRNIDQITDIMQLVHTTGVPRQSLVRVVKTGRARKNVDLLPKKEQWIALIKEVAEELGKVNQYVFLPTVPAAYYHEVVGIQQYMQWRKEGRISLCLAGITNVIVTPQGDVRPCDTSIRTSLGNVQTHSLAEIWQTSPVLERLRDLTKADFVPCNKCNFSRVCVAGCMAQSWQIDQGGEVWPADDMCVTCWEAQSQVVSC